MKTRILLLFLILVSAGPAAADGPALTPELERFEQMLVRSPSTGEAFDRIYRHYFDREQLDILADRWHREVDDRPDQADRYLLLLGYLAQRQGNLAEAQDRFREAVGRNDSSSPAWIALGNLHIRQGALGEGITALKRALETPLSAADEQEVALDLGRAQLRTFDLEGARETWNGLVESYPDDPFVLEEVGEALLQAGDFAAARETLSLLAESAQADPFRRLQARLWIAETFEREGDFDPAREGYDAVLEETQPGSWLQRQALARIEGLYAAHGKNEDLVTYYETRLAERRDLFIARRLRQILIRLNRNETADTWLRQMAEWAPTDGPLQAELARYHMNARRWDEAETILVQLTRDHPREWAYRETLGELYLQRAETGEPDYTERARETWAALAPADSPDPSRMVRLGDLYRRHDWDDLALESYRRALEAVPEDFGLREKTALFLFDLDRGEEGWALLRGDGEPLPSADSYHRLARFEYRHDKPEAALASLEMAIDLDPERYALHERHWEILAERERWEDCLERIDNLRRLLPNEFHQPRIDRRHLRALRETDQLDAKRESLETAFAEATATDEPMDEEDLRFLLFLQIADNREEAVAEITARAVPWYPDSFPITRLRLEFARNQNDLEEQHAALRRMMEQRPNRKSEWLRELVNAYRAHYRLPEARQYAEERVELNPADPEAHLLVAEIQHEAGERLEANEVLRNAILIASDPAPLRSRLAENLSQVGQYEEALELLETNFQEDPSRDARLGLVRRMSEIYLRHGNPDELLQRLSDRNPELRQTADYHFFRGEILLEASDYVRAREELERAAALEPENLDIPRSLIRLASDEDNFDEAVRYARQLFTVESSVENEMTLAKLLLRAGQVDESLEIISRHGTYFVEEEDEWSEFFEHIGEATVLDRFIQVIRNHLRTAESPWRAELALAEFFIRRGSFDEAEGLLWSVYLSEPEPVDEWDDDTDEDTMTHWMGYRMHPAQEEIQRVHFSRHHFAQLLAADHPFFSHPRHHGRHTYHHGYPSGGRNEQERARADALGYLANLAILHKNEEDFIRRWDENIRWQDLPPEKLLVEKLKLQILDDAFVAALNQVIDDGSDPDLESLVFQSLHSPETGEPVTARHGAGEGLAEAFERLRERVYEQNVEYMAWQQFREFYQSLAAGRLPDSPEETYGKIEALLQTEGAHAYFYNWVASLYLHTALIFEDYAKARELLPRVVEDAVYNPRYILASLHEQILETAVQNGRPLNEDAFTLLGELLELLLESPPSVQPFFGYMGRELTDVFPVPLSDHIEQRVIEAYRRLHTVHGRHDRQTELVDFLATESEDAAVHARQWRRSLLFFLHLWEDDLEAARTLGEEILAASRDTGIQLNMALIHERLGDDATALRLLDSLQVTHTEIFPFVQARIVATASRDEALYPVGQMAVRRLARDWDRYRFRVDADLEDLYQKVGLAEEWERREASAAPSRRRPEPAWQSVRNEMRNADDPTVSVALARRLLATAPLGFQEASVRQARHLYQSHHYAVRGLREAKQEALTALQQNGELDGYLRELEASHETNPTSIQILARLVEATEFSPPRPRPAADATVVPRDPARYYEKILSLHPNHPYFFHAYARFLNENESFDRLVELYEDQARENPLIVLRGDDEIARDAYIRADRMTELVDRLLDAPLLQLDLESAGNQNNMLARNLESAAETLEEHGFHQESLRVRSRALELLPSEETQDTRLNLIRSLRQAGANEAVENLVRAFFASPEHAETPLLFSLQRTRSNGVPPWLQAEFRSYRAARELPYSIRILKAAPGETLRALFADWEARRSEIDAPDIADALYGTLLHYALGSESYPRVLADLMQTLHEADDVTPELVPALERSFLPILLRAIPAFDTDAEIRDTLFRRQVALSDNRRLPFLHFGNDNESAWRRFDAAVALQQEDEAWETGRTLLDLLPLEGNLQDTQRPAYLRLLRLAASHLEAAAFLTLCDDLLDNAAFLHNNSELKNATLWEMERTLLRQGEIREPYISHYPDAFRSREEVAFHWEIASISPDDTIHQQDGRSFAWFYGERFEAFDGRYDVEVRVFETRDEPAVAAERIREADATGTVAISLPHGMDELWVRSILFEPDSDEIVSESQQHFIVNAPNDVDGIPLLSALSTGNGPDAAGWEVLGNHPHAGPETPFGLGRSVTLPGPGNDENGAMISGYMALDGIDALSVHAMIRHSATHPNAFELVFYDDDRNELQRQSMNLRSNPERWILYSSHYSRAESDPRPPRTHRFPADAGYVRLLIQARTPLTVGDLRIHRLP